MVPTTQTRAALLAQLRCDRRDADPCDVTLSTSVPRRERQHRRALREITVLRYRGEPLYVAKVPLGDDDGRVAAEYGKLRALGKASLCRPLRRAGQGYVMSYVPAADVPDLFLGLSADSQLGLCLSVVNEVVRLARHDPDRIIWGDDDPLEVLRSCGVDPERFAGTRTLAAARRALVGPAHGDLAAWNVRFDPLTGRVAFVDWEDYCQVGLPALDVVNFLATLAVLLYPDAQTWDELFADCFERPGTYRELVRSSIRHWTALTGSGGRDTLELLPAYCAAMVHRVTREGRSADHLFFTTFGRLFPSARLAWMDELDDHITKEGDEP
ncbi:MAG TPA: phosphotransferase [Acidimicrobiales bacterium]|jgi:hypothetical protein|nr:phosphotransferase [Acidimicrobiales bacterium]